MTNTIPNPKKWEVWLAYLRFKGFENVGKVRPILIWEKVNDSVFHVFKITSKDISDKYPIVAIQRDSGLKLVKNSHVQLEPIFDLPISDFKPVCLGVLNKENRMAVNQALELLC